MPKNLEKAKIKFLAGSREEEEISVLFNPAEYTQEISNNFQETALPGLGNPIVQFVNGNSQTVSMELFFESWTDRGGSSLVMETNEFTNMLAIDAELHAPPPVCFSWGGFSFDAVVDSISRRFTMFDSDGTPVRATLSVTFKQYRTLTEQLKRPPRESADRTKIRNFEDSLWAMARREYGDVRYWRVIAKANRIANPRLIAMGTPLILPPLEHENATQAG